MRSCEYCGTLYEEIRQDCPNCGKPAEGVMPPAAVSAPEPQPATPPVAAPQKPEIQLYWGVAEPLHVPLAPAAPPPVQNNFPPPAAGPANPMGYAHPPVPVQIQLSPEQQQDIQKNKEMAVLAYLGTFILVPAITERKSPFVKFHLNQALVLLIAQMVLGAASGLFSVVLGPLGGLLFYLGNTAVFVFWLMGLINAATGKYNPLPLVSTVQLVKY